MVLMVNDPTFLTLIIPVKDFKRIPATAMRTALESPSIDIETDSKQIMKLLSAVFAEC